MIECKALSPLKGFLPKKGAENLLMGVREQVGKSGYEGRRKEGVPGGRIQGAHYLTAPPNLCQTPWCGESKAVPLPWLPCLAFPALCPSQWYDPGGLSFPAPWALPKDRPTASLRRGREQEL